MEGLWVLALRERPRNDILNQVPTLPPRFDQGDQVWAWPLRLCRPPGAILLGPNFYFIACWIAYYLVRPSLTESASRPMPYGGLQ